MTPNSTQPAPRSVLFGGLLADRLAPRMRGSYAIVPAVSLAIAAPLYGLAMTRGDLVPFMALTIASTLLQFTYLGVTVGTLQNMMHPRMRATANAFTNIVGGLFGGLGPVVIGVLSDRLAAGGLASDLALGYAMAGAGLMSIWASAHFFFAARTVAEDLAIVREGRI